MVVVTSEVSTAADPKQKWCGECSIEVAVLIAKLERRQGRDGWQADNAAVSLRICALGCPQARAELMRRLWGM